MGILIVVVLALAGVGTTALFWVQNSARRVMLTLNLGITRFALAEPVQVPVLMAICLLVGLVLGATLVLAMRLGGRRRRSSLPPSPYDDPATPERGY